MSNNYGNRADAITHWDERDYPVPGSWTNEAIDAALLVASEWIDGRFEHAFSGRRANGRTQLRAWPRSGAFDVEGYSFSRTEIPRELLTAVYEAAFKQLAAPGSLTVDFTPTAYRRAAVDGAVSVEYMTYSAASEVQTQFPAVERAIAAILTGTGGNASALSGVTVRT